MRKTDLAPILVTAMLFLGACMPVQDLAAIQEGIETTNSTFETAFSNGDSAGLASVYTANGQILPPNGDIATGRVAIQGFWQAVLDAGVKGVRLETVELKPEGSTAWEVGKASLLGEEGVVLDTVKYIVIWKQEDGQWRWHRDIWNSNTLTP